jgi:hypothetical protein
LPSDLRLRNCGTAPRWIRHPPARPFINSARTCAASSSAVLRSSTRAPVEQPTPQAGKPALAPPGGSHQRPTKLLRRNFPPGGGRGLRKPERSVGRGGVPFFARPAVLFPSGCAPRQSVATGRATRWVCLTSNMLSVWRWLICAPTKRCRTLNNSRTRLNVSEAPFD